MTPIDPVKFQLLPKWVQNHITYLTRELESERARYRALAQSESIGETDTVMRARGMNETDVHLPKGSLIQFTVGESRIEAHVYENGLHIRSRLGGLNVRPVVSNVVTITSTRF